MTEEAKYVKTVDEFMAVCDQIRDLDGQLKKLKAEKQDLEAEVITAFQEMGLDSVRRNGRACSLMTMRDPKKHADQDVVNQALIDNGYEDLVKETVNSNTLGALLRELADNDPDGELPAWCAGVLTLEPRYRASVTAR